MGRSIPPLQQLPHGLIENRIAPQRQHITHGKHITHDNQHINKQHEHQPIGEAMTNHHAEDGDKKSILDARIERAYANEYDAAFAAATIKNYASLPLATILADHPQLLKRCTKIMGDPDIRKLTDPYAPKRDNDSYVLTVGCLAHMLRRSTRNSSSNGNPTSVMNSKASGTPCAPHCSFRWTASSAATSSSIHRRGKSPGPRGRKLQDPMWPSSTATDITA